MNKSNKNNIISSIDNDDCISIRQMMWLLKDMFDADDGANRALEAYNRGDVPYEEYELLRMKCDEIWDILKENVNNFKSLYCEDCVVFEQCKREESKCTDGCLSFKKKRNKILDNGFRPSGTDFKLCNYAIDTNNYENVTVRG